MKLWNAKKQPQENKDIAQVGKSIANHITRTGPEPRMHKKTNKQWMKDLMDVSPQKVYDWLRHPRNWDGQQESSGQWDLKKATGGAAMHCEMAMAKRTGSAVLDWGGSGAHILLTEMSNGTAAGENTYHLKIVCINLPCNSVIPLRGI